MKDQFISMIKKSPILEQMFEGYVASEGRQPKKLKKDVRTRWNSFHLMLNLFLQNLNPIEKLLIEVQSSVRFSPEEIIILEEIDEILKHVFLVSLNVCSNQCSLVQADDYFRLLLDDLSTKQSQLEKKLLKQIKNKYYSRRNHILINFIRYLLSHDSISSFSKVQKQQIFDFLYSVSTIFFVQESTEQQFNEESQRITKQIDKKTSSFNPKMSQIRTSSYLNEIQKNLKLTSLSKKTLTQKMLDYQKIKIRDNLFIIIEQNLNKISPTSLECQRHFSYINWILSNKRRKIKVNAVSLLSKTKEARFAE